ncbi:MAG: LysR family transcriptional regulator [Methylobacteriaceae bacterium]|nr:LysR family transcriptional regulator [Methylobacteriaceae bacterium]
MVRIPPLNWLRAFEAAARAAGVSQGARELNVSPSAVSQHIRRLEEALGASLHMREGNRLRLTPAGEELARRLGAAFDQIAAATIEAQAGRDDGAVVRIAAPAAFARLWLAPRAARRNRAGSGPAVTLVGAAEPADIRVVEAAEAPAPDAAALAEDVVVAVCAPALRASLRAGTRVTLLEAPDEAAAWSAFEGRGGLRLADAVRIAAPDAWAALEAARLGLGVALTRLALAREAIEAGALALAGPTRAEAATRFFAQRAGASGRAGCEAALAWIVADYAAAAEAD